ncbi:hypothetical protein CBER1_07903 [Cercospora berteroae]|uniref:Uncharacterized protein n=1 Tax=Cercospora berteroae TaxID=357750 RepID=A0A2S6BUD1_9PEZI|nr:hypothetical protein CBER1_07903 [Cercospora berteroae]
MAPTEGNGLDIDAGPLRLTWAGLRFEPTIEPRPLKEQVLEIVGPWRDSTDEPPFTTGELIVITLVIGDFEPRSMHQIQMGILAAFKYYSRMALDVYVHHLDRQAIDTDESYYALDHVLDGFYEAMKDFETPLTCTHDAEKDLDRYTISSCAARLYLHNHLQSPRDGVFDFMGLSAELREKVYKMLLVSPKPGLRYWEGPDVQDGYDERAVRLGLLSRADTEAPIYDDSSALPENNIIVGSLTKTLALLSVSKKVRQEALHVFYGRNSFHFDSLYNFPEVLETIAEDTLKQIGVLRVMVDRCRRSDDWPFQAVAHLSLKALVVVTPDHVYSRFDESMPGFMANMETIMQDERECLAFVLSLAKRAKNLEIQGSGVVGAFLREKLKESKKERGAVEEQDSENRVGSGDIDVVADLSV